MKWCYALLSLFLAALLLAAPATQPFHRTAPFILGADISWTQEDQANGTTYYDHGQQEDLLKILKDHGFNFIRLRVFVNPGAADGYAAHSQEPYCDLAHTLVMAKRVHDAGMGLLIDLHYSDNWADPSKQQTPDAWEDLSFPQLRQAVYDFTYQVLSSLKKQGTSPQMVQIGNETNNGVLWPAGRAPRNFDQFADLLKSGISAARAVDPSIKIVLHHAGGANNQVVRKWLDNLLSRGVQFDILGLSCNDVGSPQRWKENFDDLATRYPQFGLIAAEYSYHKRELNDAVFNAPDQRGLGSFIWEPTRHHEAIFDKNGHNAGGADAIPHSRPPRSKRPTSNPAGGHHPETGRFNTNQLIDLYDQLSKDFMAIVNNATKTSN